MKKHVVMDVLVGLGAIVFSGVVHANALPVIGPVVFTGGTSSVIGLWPAGSGVDTGGIDIGASGSGDHWFEIYVPLAPGHNNPVYGFNPPATFNVTLLGTNDNGANVPGHINGEIVTYDLYGAHGMDWTNTVTDNFKGKTPFAWQLPSDKNYLLDINMSGNNQSLYAETNISPVPLPGTVWLFGLALLGVVMFGRKRTTEASNGMTQVAV